MDITAVKAAQNPQAKELWLRVAESMNEETQAFVIVIVAFTLLFHVRFTPDTVVKAPAFLTTLGILGTFIGIAIGLLDFDAADVQRSVPALIDGVKTAVWASACGIFCALTIKLRDLMFKRRKGARRVSIATVDDLAESLKAIENVLGGVEQALVGDTEPSLLLQLKVAQAEQAEVMVQFGQSLTQFREELAESNMKVLVASLSEVIREFNVKLNEQFGDNFKQLNEATGKVLEWQKQYGQQVEQAVLVQGETAQNMREASASYQRLVAQSEVFNGVAHSLSVLLSGLDEQRVYMTENLTQLATLVSGAAQGLPKLEGHITALTQQMTEGMKTANTEFNHEVRSMIEATKAQVMQLDNALSEELTKALDTFGRQLASLSSKFAQDYGPITERLQAVLRIAG